MLVAALIELKSAGFRSVAPLRLATIGAVLLAAFRWNGPVALGLLSIMLLVIHRRSSVRVIGGVTLAALVAIASLFVPQRMTLTESTTWFNFEVRELHDLAYVYKTAPSAFTESDLDLLASVMPLTEWAIGGASCEGVEVLQYKNFARYAPASFDVAKQRREELRRTWRQIVLRAPRQVATVRACRAGGVLSPVFFGQQPTLGLRHEDAPDVELVRAKYVPAAESILTGVVRMTSTSEISKTIFLNAMLWTLIALVVAVRARSSPPGIGGVLVVGASIMISVALAANAHDARYVAGALLSAQYYVLYWAVSQLSGWRRRAMATTATR